VIDLIRLAILAVHSRRALAAENLFLRKQLALFQERQVKPRRANDSTRWMMATLSRMFPWRDALVNVKASTLIRWHRQGFRLFWRWKSKPMGRPRLPRDLRRLIREMAAENATWGEERIANELKLKLGIRVSPRTVENYLRDGGPARTPDPKQRWLTFIHNYVLLVRSGMVDSARFRFVNKKLTNGVRSAAANGDGPPNQCKGSDENRGHALQRVWNTSLMAALACRGHFHSGKSVKCVGFWC